MERYWNENMECATKDEMKALQSFRLSQTVRKVYNNVPYYRERMEKAGVTPDDIHSVEDLKKLPFTMKQDLRDTYPYGLFAVPMEDVVRVHASSGTTGKQIVVGYTQHDLDVWSECCARALTAAGATNKDFMHVSYGYGLFTGGLGLHGGAEKVGMTVIPVSTGNTNRQINIIKDFGSTYICCTPSYALYLAETMEEMGITKDDIKLKAGLFGAEPWTEEMRHEIEEKLGLKALDIYGLTEIIGPGVAFECSEQSGMHINEDHFIAETIDPDTGEVLPEGTQGEIVFTCISKEAFPLLRYRTRDIGILKREKCSCGRTLIKMMKPAGRSDDMLIIRGVNVFPSQVESVLLQLGNTAPYYQLIVDRVNNTDTLEIQVEISPEMFSDTVKSLEDQEKIIKSAVESTLGIAAKIRLVEPKTIQRTEGKAIRVIDKRK
ncbi:phenylacetate--CoA ligase [Porcipelethomonas sp.]|jgi:phenylacetate-CoA ligase|uniref:phenylacetate--CoA ligase family protein n=1 Tax=Porcipelethomonas sp. TaxID=2981675 RepID=UPI000959489C|nr:phenylacetate--CoA ligase [Ruminococcus sp.]MEE0185109.1 phenylacetate--CoA ligase [Oscillospiraceae bacterium]OLA68716.1 MAG: phenylacetate--CoA ligase [Ruminococcus sp. 37_24]